MPIAVSPISNPAWALINSTSTGSCINLRAANWPEPPAWRLGRDTDDFQTKLLYNLTFNNEARLTCSQPWTARWIPFSSRISRMVFTMISPISWLDSLPIWPPITSLEERPKTKIDPCFKLAFSIHLYNLACFSLNVFFPSYLDTSLSLSYHIVFYVLAR